jgi:hypothetical protein
LANSGQADRRDEIVLDGRRSLAADPRFSRSDPAWDRIHATGGGFAGLL